MKTSELVKIVNSINDLILEMQAKLPTAELEQLNVRALESFSQNANALVSSKVASVDNKNDVLSSKMSYENMTLADFQYFYKITEMRDNEREKLIGALQGLTDFAYPVLELFPGEGFFTEAGVAGEPLYIVDYYKEMLEHAASRFNPFYSTRRLMKAVVRDFDLSKLPQEQFGVAFCYNYFFVRNLEFILGWATEIHKVLRPGGYFIFNFIPVDTVWGLELTEQYRLTAIDHIRLEELLKNIGYEIVRKNLEPNYASTMLVKKAGDIIPFKLSSAAARIIDRTEPFI